MEPRAPTAVCLRKNQDAQDFTQLLIREAVLQIRELYQLRRLAVPTRHRLDQPVECVHRACPLVGKHGVTPELVPHHVAEPFQPLGAREPGGTLCFRRNRRLWVGFEPAAVGPKGMSGGQGHHLPCLSGRQVALGFRGPGAVVYALRIATDAVLRGLAAERFDARIEEP